MSETTSVIDASSGAESRPTATSQPRVQFVGTGPGDPSLLTIAAVRAINAAQVIVLTCPAHRDLVESDVLALHDEVRIVPAGISAEESDEQAEADLTAELVDSARRGLDVVRLVSGDPFLDGDVAAEAAALAKADIDVDVMPGISPLTSVPEYAGVTLHGHDVQLIGPTAAKRDFQEGGHPLSLIHI